MGQRGRVSSLKIATYNARTLLRDEHVHELQAGVGFLINKKFKDHIVCVNNISPSVAEFVLRTKWATHQ